MLACACCIVGCGPEIEADLVLVNGNVVTVDTSFSVQSAMAVKDGKILAVGTDEEIEAYRGSTTQYLNLNGKAVMPGLIDSHTHPASSSIVEYDHEIPSMETIENVLDYIRSRAATLEDGEWIWVSQVFLTRLKEQRYPTKKELDEAAPRNPTVFQTGPDASVNSLALKLSGINERWKVTDGGPGYAEKDPRTGRLTGILRSCTRYLKSHSSTNIPSQEEHIAWFKKLLADYNRVGITSVGERDASEDEIRLYSKMRNEGDLTVRAYLSKHVGTIPEIEEIRKEIQTVGESSLYVGDDMLRVPAIKTYLDGGMLTGSAYMREPWGVSNLYGITDPDYQGLRFIPQDKLVEIMAACFERDVQFTAHCVGDGAVHAFIDACEILSERFDVASKRPVICHSNFMSEEAVGRAASMGIPVDIQPAWLYLDGRTLHHHFGYERLAWFQPLKAIFEAGGVVGGGSDHMQKIGSIRSINFYDPWMAMWVAMTRTARWLDEPLHTEHALSREEVIRFYTINNAYLFLAEDKLGSLETGKLADFIVLSDDILSCSPEQIRNMKVERTYLGGELVYSSAS
jgi:predicted amidohydrolase YtcJ